MTEVVSAPPRGWYPDPRTATPDQERWWSGDDWSKHTWRPSWSDRHLPRIIPTSQAYSRSMRIGANTVLRPVFVLQAIVIVLLLASPFAWYLAGAGDAGRQAYTIAVGVQVGTIAAASTLGVIGAILSRRLGGLAAALSGLALSLFLFAMTAVAASIMFAAIRTIG